LPDSYVDILEEIKRKIKEAQLRALKAVNNELISIYREIGRTIHDRQTEGSWGTSVVELFAKDLQKSFPGMKIQWVLNEIYSVDSRIGISPTTFENGLVAGAGF
jgi:hypothetical protein